MRKCRGKLTAPLLLVSLSYKGPGKQWPPESVGGIIAAMDTGQMLARLLLSLPLRGDDLQVDFEQGEILLATNRPFVVCSGPVAQRPGGALIDVRLRVVMVVAGSGDILYETRVVPAKGEPLGIAVLYKGPSLHQAALAAAEQAEEWGDSDLFPVGPEEAAEMIDVFYEEVESSRRAINCPVGL